MDCLRAGGKGHLTIHCSDPGAQYQAHKTTIDAAIRRVLESGRYLSGDEVPAFEEEFGAYVGVDHGVGVASGTAALELALRACGVGPGDEVVTVSHTAVATVAAIQRTGADPVLVDIEPDRYTLDPKRLNEVITDRTKAIVPVHLYGQPADMEAILEIARKADVRVIEDCAQANGARWRDKRVGSLGDAGCFSFYPTKNLGALGDAGMAVTRDALVAEKMRRLREYGWNSERESIVPGSNARLDELQAAVLRDKLTRLDSGNARRAEIAGRYGELLAETPLELPQVQADTQHPFHLYVVRAAARDELLGHLRDQGIMAGVHYRQPVHEQQAYRGKLRTGSNLSATEQAASKVLSLPIYPELTEQQQDRVVAAIKAFYNSP